MVELHVATLGVRAVEVTEATDEDDAAAAAAAVGIDVGEEATGSDGDAEDVEEDAVAVEEDDVAEDTEEVGTADAEGATEAISGSGGMSVSCRCSRFAL